MLAANSLRLFYLFFNYPIEKCKGPMQESHHGFSNNFPTFASSWWDFTTLLKSYVEVAYRKNTTCLFRDLLPKLSWALLWMVYYHSGSCSVWQAKISKLPPSHPTTGENFPSFFQVQHRTDKAKITRTLLLLKFNRAMASSNSLYCAGCGKIQGMEKG